MMAVVAYLGIVYSAEATVRGAESYFNAHRMWDIQITSTLLMGQEDLDAVRALDYVELAEPVQVFPAYLMAEGQKENVSLMSLSKELAAYDLTAGRPPETTQECMLEKSIADAYGYEVGSRIHLENETLAGIDPILQKDYVVSGLFIHPDHISPQVPLTPYILVLDACFDQETLDEQFSQMLVQVQFLHRLEELALPSLGARQESLVIEPNGHFASATLLCADPAGLSEFYGLYDAKTAQPLAVPGSGALVPKRFHEAYEIPVGDSFTLSKTYILKKSRELTIMRINGFTVKECVRYAAWDLFLTTVAGILLGMAVGGPLGSWVIQRLEQPFLQYVRTPDVRSFIFGALITAAFSYLINASALRRVKHLKLSDLS